jgi:DNA-directed RNA polymerase specialized sigma24 family protein
MTFIIKNSSVPDYSMNELTQSRYPETEVNMQEHTLNVLYSMFIEKKINRGKFEGLIFKYLIDNQTKLIVRYWRHDEYEEFISWFYPRLKKAIDSYKETGSSFEAFLSNIVRTVAKEYRMRLAINEVTEQSAWNAQIPDFFAREETPVYSHDKPDNEISQLILQIKGRKNPKQLLALILKCYFYISDEFIDKIAVHTKLNKKILKEMVEKLRAIREKKEDALYRMKERIYGQFYRCIAYEHRLSFITDNTVVWFKLKQRLEKARSRLEKMRNRILKVRTYPSNREIAGVIGVTKGSVDASLFKLRIKLNALADINAIADKSILN